MKKLIKRYLQLRRSMGAILCGDERILNNFSTWLNHAFPGTKYLSRPVVEKYLETIGHLHATSQRDHLSKLRQFSRFLFQLDGKSYIPSSSLTPPARTKLKPHIYTEDEVRGLIKEAAKLTPSDSLRPHTYTTLIGLLWTTGLRIGEITRLDLADVDLHEGILIIRKTKFFKSRIVPISKSCRRALVNYCSKRNRYFGHLSNPSTPFFINEREQRCTTNTIQRTFRDMTRKLEFRTSQGTEPRLHDLRHTFATRWLSDLYMHGKDPNAILPVLATYLGHTHVSHTQIYLHPSIEVLRQAGQKLQVAFSKK